MSERPPGAWKEGATAAVLRPYPKGHRGGVPDICDSWNEFLNQNSFKSVGVMPRGSRSALPWEDQRSMSLGFAVDANREAFKTAFWLTVLNPSPSRIKKLIPFFTANGHNGNNDNTFTTDARFVSWDPRDPGEKRKIWDLANRDYIDAHDPEMYGPAYYVGLTGKVVERFNHLGRVVTSTIHPDTTLPHMRDFWLAYWLQNTFHFSDAVIVNTPQMALNYGQVLKNITVIENPTDTEKFTPIGPKLENFGDTNFLDGKANVVYVGRLEQRKGLVTALKAIAILARNEDLPKNFRFIIAGSGPLEKELHQMVNEHRINNYVTFMGEISEEDKPKLYRTANFCYFPSESEESFGNVLLEAWASGVPTLAGKAYSDYLVKHGQNGFLLNSDDPLEAAFYLTRMINNPQWVRNMGSEALKLVQPFDKRRIFDRKMGLVLSVHQDKINSHRRKRTVSYPS